ncbi:Spy/CpxP family protein refolding chaperone [Herbaspirillum rhizosphaerae]|uniref:Spy/CpxP family protein refolding chaperone n=1 Tax=Herbaspirillum rhizosphaerae TaxID=346179 RepID=UPI00067AD1D0|nr:Spy/CpxP family protein refolding chaperone [Herbaspirillum rhizosphaerae]
MLNLKKRLMIGVAAAGIGLTAMSSFAQMPPADGNAPAGRHAPTADQIAKFEQHRAKRQAALHDKLKITAAQEGAWKTFTEKTTPMHPATPPVRPSKDEWNKLTTPERLDRHLDMMKKMEARMTDRIAATKEFYAVLSPEQQKTFDQEFRKMEEHRFKHGRFGHDQGGDHGPKK